MAKDSDIKCSQNLRLPVSLAEKLRKAATEDLRNISDEAVYLMELGLKAREKQLAPA